MVGGPQLYPLVIIHHLRYTNPSLLYQQDIRKLNSVSLESKIQGIGQKAKDAITTAGLLSTDQKNALLEKMAQALLDHKEKIQEINKKDLEAGKKKRLTQALLDRLTLTDDRILQMAEGLREVATLPDPVRQVIKEWERPNGLKVQKIRIPLGVIGIIYESRPNVTVDAAGLCLKSGNVIILRGGSEAIHSNTFLTQILREVCEDNGVNPDIIQIVKTTDREAMKILVRQTNYIDLIIPRGGEALMKWMADHSKVPVIKHDRGTCHVFVDDEATIDMALDISFNSKVQRPGVCNAMETLLVHEKIAPKFLPLMVKKFQEAGVTLKGCSKTCSLIPGIKKAAKKDWPEEYLDLILSIKVVSSSDEAIEHIRKYGSLHTEVIVTENKKTAEKFIKALDSSMIGWNCSTRFNDGGQLGLGAEIGISTTKLHAFGPMGLEELTISKFVVIGKGQVRTR